ncbi:hypothetical protein HPB52_006831 [Rhipicephalus sanguineus]|uniref:Uncharacterized protein n=1 Tax=Rhipicephalus sanguineus TaxID=34632 RepID=A0A9D4PI77_RHISA|nr:hypothetical protein HPB52_006831 [Rhipicephalus sanguineus]
MAPALARRQRTLKLRRSLLPPPSLCLHQETMRLWLCFPRWRLRSLTTPLRALLDAYVATVAIEDTSPAFVEGTNRTSNATTFPTNAQASVRPRATSGRPTALPTIFHLLLPTVLICLRIHHVLGPFTHHGANRVASHFAFLCTQATIA